MISDTDRLNFVIANDLEIVPREITPGKKLWNILKADGPHSQVGIASHPDLREAIDSLLLIQNDSILDAER